jgi:hypothetical protein
MLAISASGVRVVYGLLDVLVVLYQPIERCDPSPVVLPTKEWFSSATLHRLLKSLESHAFPNSLLNFLTSGIRESVYLREFSSIPIPRIRKLLRPHKRL